MVLPIYAYGQRVLKQKAKEISPDYPGFHQLISNMWDTMYNAQGVGLAAPQIGLSIRLFIVDTVQLMEEGEEEKGIKQVFVNPVRVEESGEAWTYEEGCLSIPNIRGDVQRKPTLRLRYLNENFESCIQTFDEIHARVIQHEYDHLEGILFTELLKPVKKNLIRRKLENIKKGKVGEIKYPLKFSK